MSLRLLEPLHEFNFRQDYTDKSNRKFTDAGTLNPAGCCDNGVYACCCPCLHTGCATPVFLQNMTVSELPRHTFKLRAPAPAGTWYR